MPPAVLGTATNIVHLPQARSVQVSPPKTSAHMEQVDDFRPRDDTSGATLRVFDEEPSALHGPLTQLVDDCFDEDQFEQGLETLSQVCSQAIVPTKSHIRQIFALALCTASASLNPQPQPPRPASEAAHHSETGQPKRATILSARAFLAESGRMSPLNASHVLAAIPDLASEPNNSTSRAAVELHRSPGDAEHIDASAIAQQASRIKALRTGVFRGLLLLDEFWLARVRTRPSVAAGKGKSKGKLKAIKTEDNVGLQIDDDEAEEQEDDSDDEISSGESLFRDPRDFSRGQPHSEGAWGTLAVLVNLWKQERLALQADIVEDTDDLVQPAEEALREKWVSALHLARQFRGLAPPDKNDANKKRKKQKPLEATADVGHALDLAFAPFGISRVKEAERHAKRVRAMGVAATAVPLPDEAEWSARRKVAASFLNEVLHLAALPLALIEPDALVRGMARKLRGVAWNALTMLDETLRSSPTAHLLFARAVALMLRARTQKPTTSNKEEWTIAAQMQALLPRALDEDHESLAQLLSELSRPLSGAVPPNPTVWSLLLPIGLPTARATILHMRPATLARLQTIVEAGKTRARVIVPLPRGKIRNPSTESNAEESDADELSWRLADLADAFTVLGGAAGSRAARYPWIRPKSADRKGTSIPPGPRSKKVAVLARTALHATSAGVARRDKAGAKHTEEATYDLLALALTAETRRAELSALSVDFYARYLLLRTVIQWTDQLAQYPDMFSFTEEEDEDMDVSEVAIREAAAEAMDSLANFMELTLGDAELSIEALEVRLARERRSWSDDAEESEDAFAPLTAEARSTLRLAIMDARAQLGRVQGVIDAAALGHLFGTHHVVDEAREDEDGDTSMAAGGNNASALSRTESAGGPSSSAPSSQGVRHQLPIMSTPARRVTAPSNQAGDLGMDVDDAEGSELLASPPAARGFRRVASGDTTAESQHSVSQHHTRAVPRTTATTPTELPAVLRTPQAARPIYPSLTPSSSGEHRTSPPTPRSSGSRPRPRLAYERPSIQRTPTAAPKSSQASNASRASRSSGVSKAEAIEVSSSSSGNGSNDSSSDGIVVLS